MILITCLPVSWAISGWPRYPLPQNPVFEMLDEAEKAAVRSRDLTQQLLTFARGGKPFKKLVNITAVIKESATFAYGAPT